MRRRPGMREPAWRAPTLLLVFLVATTLSPAPAAASVPHELTAELGSLLGKLGRTVGLNLATFFGSGAKLQASSARALLEDDADCLLPVWSCPNCVSVPDAVYQTVNNSTCVPVSGLDLSVCGSSIIDASVITAVQSNLCTRTCAGSSSLQCPGAPATGSSPSPSSPVSPVSSPAGLVSTPSPTAASPSVPSYGNPPLSPSSFSPSEAAPGCSTSEASYICNYGGCSEYIAPVMYDYIKAANTTCTTVLNQVICGCYAMDQSTYAAAVNGTCTLSCPTQNKACGTGPAPAPGPVPAGTPASPTLFGPSPTPRSTAVATPPATPEATPALSASTPTPIPASPESSPSSTLPSATSPPVASSPETATPASSPTPSNPLSSTPANALPSASSPAQAPAVAPGACPASDCIRPQYQCGSYSISLALHNAVDAATSCTPDLDPDFCIVDEYIVELPLWAAIKANDCSLFCLNGASRTCLAAPAPAPAPAPAIVASIPSLAPVSVTPTPTPTQTPVVDAAWAGPTPPAPSTKGLAPFSLKYGAYGDCSAQCNGGNATRPLTCVSTEYGLPVELSNCQYTASTIANLSESCNTAACGQYYFVAGAWGACSAMCGDSGTASRNVTCMHQGQPVSSSSVAAEEYSQNCLPLGEPVSIKQCFATPCEPYMWQLAAWGNCTGGQQNRTVSCQRVKGGFTDASVCTSQLGYTPLSSRLCNTFSCNSTSDCLGNGVCNTSTSSCQCNAGFTGQNCGISTGLCNTTAVAAGATVSSANASQICCSTGVVNSTGGCCNSGVVSELGSCCAINSTAGATVTLDRAGNCCSQGLDACGVCGGDGVVVDFTGVCCNGALDASGLCCAQPHVVDDFGVCGGNSSTGVIVLDLSVLSTSVSGLANGSSAEHANFTNSYESLLEQVLSVPASQTQLYSLQVSGSAPTSSPSRRRLMATEGTDEVGRQAMGGKWTSHFRSLLVNTAQVAHLESLFGVRSSSTPLVLNPPTLNTAPFLGLAPNPHKQAHHTRALLASSPYTVGTTAGVSPPYPTLTLPQIYSLLEAAYSNTTNSAGIALKQLLSVSKQGVAGNGLCETGETPSTDGNFTGVPADCPLTFHALPSSSGEQCSGHGAPVAAQGVCQCYVGYDGTSCSGCANGYQRVGGICQRTLTSFKVQAALAATAQANASSQKTSGASVGLIAGAVIAGVAAMLVAVALFTTYRRRRSSSKHVYFKSNPAATDRVSGDLTSASRQGSQSSGLTGGMAWAFQDPEHGSTTSRAASAAPTTTFVNPEYQPLNTHRSQAVEDAESTLSSQQQNNFKMVLVNNKPMQSWYNWLTAAGVTQDQVEVRRLGSSERDTERGPASPPPAKKPSLLQRAYQLTMGTAADGSTVSSAKSSLRGFLGSTFGDSDSKGRSGRAGAGGNITILEPEYADMDRARADKKARRGSLAFSSGSEASSDASSARDARRSLYGLTMGDSSGIGRGGTPGAAHRVAGVAMFEDAPTARAGGRKDAKGSTFASMAFADMENENQVGPMKTFSKGSSKGSSSSGSQGSARSGPAGSLAFTSSSGGISRSKNWAMESNMAFSDSDGAATKRSHSTGFFAFSQAAEEEERRGARPNYAMSDDVSGNPPAGHGGSFRGAPLRELTRTESILSTQSTRRNYAYTMADAPGGSQNRKHLNTFSAVDAYEDMVEEDTSGSRRLQNPSQASLAASSSGSDQSASQLLFPNPKRS